MIICKFNGRVWNNSTEYRYGFNGKEKDDKDEWGNTSYDYGFRIYDPEIAKFLSVDPITKSYPMLTPYQFASNRPIDGIDLDGLEYIHYYVFLKKDGSFLRKQIAIDYRDMTADEIKRIHGVNDYFFYMTYSQSFGPEGRGVLYTYFTLNDDGSVTRLGSDWEVRQDGIGSELERTGLYYGRGSVTKRGPAFEPGVGEYDFSLKPNDLTDAIARLHDIEEDYEGFISYKDSRNIYADIRFVKRLKLFVMKVDAGELVIDPYTNRQVSNEAYKSAKNAIAFFSYQINQKIKTKRQSYNHRRKGFDKEGFEKWIKTVNETWKQDVELPDPSKEDPKIPTLSK